MLKVLNGSITPTFKVQSFLKSLELKHEFHLNASSSSKILTSIHYGREMAETLAKFLLATIMAMKSLHLFLFDFLSLVQNEPLLLLTTECAKCIFKVK